MEKIAVNKNLFEFRKTVKLFIQYLGVVFSAVPAGILLFFLSDHVNQTAALILALGFGFLIASYWRFIYLPSLPSKESQDKLREEIHFNLVMNKIESLEHRIQDLKHLYLKDSKEVELNPKKSNLELSSLELLQIKGTASFANYLLGELNKTKYKLSSLEIREKYSQRDIKKIHEEIDVLLSKCKRVYTENMNIFRKNVGSFEAIKYKTNKLL
jgi:hypothetical protein